MVLYCSKMNVLKHMGFLIRAPKSGVPSQRPILHLEGMKIYVHFVLDKLQGHQQGWVGWDSYRCAPWTVHLAKGVSPKFYTCMGLILSQVAAQTCPGSCQRMYGFCWVSLDFAPGWCLCGSCGGSCRLKGTHASNVNVFGGCNLHGLYMIRAIYMGCI